MNIQTIKEIFTTAARRIVRRQYRYLVLERSRLSEPEVRHVVTKILDEKHIYYSFEYPTVIKHKISGTSRSRSALADLALYEEDNKKESVIWVEFKKAQPSINKIIKDFIKMRMEKGLEGVCFFHILPKLRVRSERSKLRAQKAILKKYIDAYQSIKEHNCEKKWLILFILDCENKQYYYCQKDDICHIDNLSDGHWGEIQ